MTKFETKQVKQIQAYQQAGLGADYAARALSALIRATRNSKSDAELRALAQEWNLTTNAEFIA